MIERSDSAKEKTNGANLGIGVGLRHPHFSDFLAIKPDKISYLEIITENFLIAKGRAAYVLDELREIYPVIMHGVSLSVGGCDPLNSSYLKDVNALAKRCDAVHISDHLCWTGIHGKNTHDLLPIPYNEESLSHLITRVKQVQDIIEQPLVLENPSSYLEFKISTMQEWDFLETLCHETGAKILLDINNVFVSSRNHGFDPLAYLQNISPEHISQYHLAGHTDKGSFVLDSHIGPVPDSVCALYSFCLELHGNRPTILEWDEQIPDFTALMDEHKRLSQLTRKERNVTRSFENASRAVSNEA